MSDAQRPRGPLDGVRIIELAGMGVAPYAAMVLADLGADVVRLDRVGGDPLQEPENQYDGRPTDFLIRRGRQSIAVDLKAPGGADLVLRLVADADALIEGFRPGVAERLGIGPSACHARNRALVYVRATGWGQEGPYSAAPGHDLNYVALSGALLAMGRKESPPPPPLNLVGDFAGGALFAVIGLLSALVHARRTGAGQVIDANMLDGVAHLTTLYHGMLAVGAWSEERESNLLDGGSPLYDVYETRDGGFMSVAAGEPRFVAALLEALGLTEQFSGVDVRDRARWPNLRDALRRTFRTRTRDEWTELLAGNPRQCCAPVLSFTEAPANEHTRARGTFVEHDGVVQPIPAPRFSATPARLDLPAPQPGQHTLDALTRLGFGADEIERLQATGVVRQRPPDASS
jgi:alpha-methylacyl-CoA racemase